MKFITILMTIFALKSCGNSKSVANTVDNSSNKQAELLSGTYKVTFIENNSEIPEELHITFDETAHKVSGYSGCNNFFGNYTLEGNSITFGDFGTTKRLCKRFMDVEQNMMNAITQANTISIEGDALRLYNEKLGLLIKLTKANHTKIAQNEGYTLEYIAETRGSYKMISISNNTINYSTVRGAEPLSRVCSEDEVKSIAMLLSALELEKIPTLKAPSEERHTDRTAIGRFKITHNGISYETPQFDDGNPNAYIADLVLAMVSMTEKQ